MSLAVVPPRAANTTLAASAAFAAGGKTPCRSRHPSPRRHSRTRSQAGFLVYGSSYRPSLLRATGGMPVMHEWRVLAFVPDYSGGSTVDSHHLPSSSAPRRTPAIAEDSLVNAAPLPRDPQNECDALSLTCRRSASSIQPRTRRVNAPGVATVLAAALRPQGARALLGAFSPWTPG